MHHHIEESVIVVPIGGPCCGKGTIAKEARGYHHWNTGKFLRHRALADATIRNFLDSGTLVPDEVLVPLFLEVWTEIKSHRRIILDGFPRNLFQCESLARVIDGRKLVVVHLDIGEEKIRNRMIMRVEEENRTDDKIAHAREERIVQWRKHKPTLLSMLRKHAWVYQKIDVNYRTREEVAFQFMDVLQQVERSLRVNHGSFYRRDFHALA